MTHDHDRVHLLDDDERVDLLLVRHVVVRERLAGRPPELLRRQQRRQQALVLRALGDALGDRQGVGGGRLEEELDTARVAHLLRELPGAALARLQAARRRGDGGAALAVDGRQRGVARLRDGAGARLAVLLEVEPGGAAPHEVLVDGRCGRGLAGCLVCFFGVFLVVLRRGGGGVFFVAGRGAGGEFFFFFFF
jgi:hypothetical protein